MTGVLKAAKDWGCNIDPETKEPPISVPPQYSIIGLYSANYQSIPLPMVDFLPTHTPHAQAHLALARGPGAQNGDGSGSDTMSRTFLGLTQPQKLAQEVAEKILDKKELEFYKWDGELSLLLQNVIDKLNKVAENWTREEKNHCLEETEKSFEFSGAIL
ncbi:hypothetical protein T459_24257 [Capsicum annuum]|uniref:heme oxygenase (biliverdin-producing) n=1 Tax=Capsicum annuum TaxID=4072 RepID=A0A2G2YUQ1_CAPAN|nr:hypothetical protein T459_24257 [Capsicum annuum]